jgi:hypothetical protein
MNNKKTNCCLKVRVIFTIIALTAITIIALVDNHRLSKVLENQTKSETKITYTLQPMK